MFYSSDKRLLFVHIPKTAGTSLKIALRPYFNSSPEAISSHKPLIEHLQNVPGTLRARGMFFPNHMTYREAEQFTDIDLGQLTAFSIVRNPWERTASLYRHIARDPTHNLHGFARAEGFKGFLAALLDANGPARAPDTLPQIDYISDRYGSVGTRMLLKQEQLVPGLRALCDRLGLSLVLPRTNVAPEPRSDLGEDRETHDMVAAYEAGIIRLLGYGDEYPEGEGGALVELRAAVQDGAEPSRPASIQPADPAATLTAAMHALRQGHAERASAAFRTVLAAEPENPVAIHFMGLAQHNLGNDDAALALMQRAVVLAPERHEFWRNLGSLLKATGALDAAKKALERAVDLAADDAEAWALLCETQNKLELPDAAREAGQRALELKDKAACGSHAPSPVSGAMPPFRADARRRNIIAMTLFGEDPYYQDGARLNAQLARFIYPEWMCRFYCDAAVPRVLIDQLLALGAQVIRYPKRAEGNEALFWRFRVANDPDVDRFLCRDCDSPFTVRERVAVEEWIALGTPFHVLRDHLIHTELILAGLWGGVSGILPNMDELAAAQLSLYRGRWADQQMLAREIWPRIRDVATIHDSQYTLGKSRSFPRFGTLPPPLHAGYSMPRQVSRRRAEFQPEGGGPDG